MARRNAPGNDGHRRSGKRTSNSGSPGNSKKSSGSYPPKKRTSDLKPFGDRRKAKDDFRSGEGNFRSGKKDESGFSRPRGGRSTEKPSDGRRKNYSSSSDDKRGSKSRSSSANPGAKSYSDSGKFTKGRAGFSGKSRDGFSEAKGGKFSDRSKGSKFTPRDKDERFKKGEGGDDQRSGSFGKSKRFSNEKSGGFSKDRKERGERFPVDKKSGFRNSDKKDSREGSGEGKRSYGSGRSSGAPKSFARGKTGGFPKDRKERDGQFPRDKRQESRYSDKKDFRPTDREATRKTEDKFADKKERRPRKFSGSTTDEQGSAPRSRNEIPVQTGQIRLNRFIANSGVCSRREADELITMGLISVNGKTITEMGHKVNPGDEVRYEDRVLRAERPVYILLNKPKGFLTTTSDPQERKTVMHLVANAVKERVYPVGRLDRNTTGLLLLTNDGDLADKLMHPSYNIKKIYKVDLDKALTKADFQKIQEGIELEEGKAVVDDIAIVSDDGKTVGIELHIGWNRVVRRIFESLGYEVEKLDRSVYAGLDKKDLPRGHWRFLSKEEIVRLKHYK